MARIPGRQPVGGSERIVIAAALLAAAENQDENVPVHVERTLAFCAVVAVSRIGKMVRAPLRKWVRRSA